MRTTTVTKSVKALTPGEYERCRRLNFRERGMMQDDIRRLRTWDKDDNAKVIMIKNEYGRLISWSLVQSHGEDGISAQFYTRTTMRGKGYGKRLMKQVMKINENPHVYPHDDRSAGFFKSYDEMVRVSAMDSHWLKD